MLRLLHLGGFTAVLLFGSLLSACGGDDDGPNDPNPPPPGDLALHVVGGGGNVEDRFTSDLWVHGSHAYTGTWGIRAQNAGDVVEIWNLDASGAPVLADSVVIEGILTVSDVEVSADGTLLLASTEGAENVGLYLYSLADPIHPALLDTAMVDTGLHTATFASIGDRR